VGDPEAARDRARPAKRDGTTWAAFLRGQAHAIVGLDFFTATSLSGTTYGVFAATEHSTRRIRVLGAAVHPTAVWVTQIARTMVMDLQDAGAMAKYLIRNRDSTFTAEFDAVFAGEGIEVVTTGIRMPRVGSIIERWVQTCRLELLERLCSGARASPLRAPGVRAVLQRTPAAPRPARRGTLPPATRPITDTARIDHLEIHRHDQLGGILRAYAHVA
jgi:putative transposase